MSFYNDMEQVIKANGERGLIQLEYYYGMKCELYRNTTDDVYSRVHGRSDGKEGSKIADFTGIIEGAEFSASNNFYSSDHVLAILYTRYDNIKAGDTVKVVSDDGKVRRFKVNEKRNIGFTTEIFSMWGMSSIGD